MLETLLKVLAVHVQSPEIYLEDDGDICLDWNGDMLLSISPTGAVNWAASPNEHGTDLNRFLEILKGKEMVK